MSLLAIASLVALSMPAAQAQSWPDFTLNWNTGSIDDHFANPAWPEKTIDIAACDEREYLLSKTTDGRYRVAVIDGGVRVSSTLISAATGNLIALDCYESAGDGTSYEYDSVLALRDTGIITSVVWMPASNLISAYDWSSVPLSANEEPWDIAGDSPYIYITTSRPLNAWEDTIRLRQWKSGVGWSSVDLDFTVVAKAPDEERPGVDADKAWGRACVASRTHLSCFNSSLVEVGSYTLDFEPTEPHLGKEFAVEDGMLLYINRSVLYNGAQRNGMRLARLGADVEYLDDEWLPATLLNLQAMTIRPVPYELWNHAGQCEDYVAFTALQYSTKHGYLETAFSYCH